MIEKKDLKILYVCAIIDTAVPGDYYIDHKEIQKVEKNQDLKEDVTRFFHTRKVFVIHEIWFYHKSC